MFHSFLIHQDIQRIESLMTYERMGVSGWPLNGNMGAVDASRTGLFCTGQQTLSPLHVEHFKVLATPKNYRHFVS